MSENSKTCLFLMAEKDKYGIHKILKPYNPVYNGVGWFFEEKYRDEIEQISQKAKMRLIEWPLNESFDQFRRNHRKDFYHQKSIELGLTVEGLKATLGVSDIHVEDLVEGDQRERLEKLQSGKRLLECIEEQKRYQSQLTRIDEEERIANISIDLVDTTPYTYEKLKSDLCQTKEGLKTGYGELDEMVRIPNEAITLVGGRPSHGKTTFMLNLFLNLIEQYPNQHFYFFTYEETRQQIAVKIINILSGFIFDETKNIINLEGYLKLDNDKKSRLNEVEKGIKRYQELVESGRLRIISEPFYIQQLPVIISSLKSKIPLGAVFIDYIQKIKNKDRFGTRQLELANTSGIILEIAKAYSIPIILGAQLSRDKESRDKVKLDNLRESGDLEQDANLVLGIFNPSMEKAQDEQKQLTDRKIELKVTPLKNRNGIANKTIILEFDRPILKISTTKKDTPK